MTILYDGFVKVIDQEVCLPDGRIKHYDVVDSPDAVGILAIIENKVLLVKQYRPSFQKKILEIPAGRMEKGETPIESAKRELREETGYQAKSMLELGEMYPSVGYTNEVIHLFLARDLTLGPTDLDIDEFIEVEQVSIIQMEELVKNNQIKDAKTVFAFLKFSSIK